MINMRYPIIGASYLKLYHYVYRITIKNRHYYGIRSTNDLPNKDLGIKYFSSSSIINNLIRCYGKEQARFKIVKLFPNREDALLYEILLHNKFDVENNIKFWNIRNQRSKYFDYSTSSLNKKAMYNSNANTIVFVNKDCVEEYNYMGYVLGVPGWKREKCSLPGTKNPFFGKEHSAETKKKLSDHRSMPIKVRFIDEYEIILRNRNELGEYIGMSVSLGASLVTRKRTHLFKKYNIKYIEVNDEIIEHKEN